MIAKLAQVEWLKARHRIGFWVATLGFATLAGLGMGVEYYAHRRLGAGYLYTPAWGGALGAIESFGFLIIIVLIVQLTASEKTWRTERQNVIDGLSRQQYFLGKLLLLVGCALLLWLIALIFGAAFEVANRALTETVLPFMQQEHVTRALALLLYLLVLGSIALMFGCVASSSGAALALAFLFLIMQAPIGMIMARQGGLWLDATAYLPMNVLNSLSSSATWNAENYARMQQQMQEMGMPLMLSGPRAAALGVIYAAMACGIAFWSIRTRDL